MMYITKFVLYNKQVLCGNVIAFLFSNYVSLINTSTGILAIYTVHSIQ